MLNDKTSVSQWFQRNRAVVWAVPWILSLLWATLGLVLAGYGDIGACRCLLRHTTRVSLLTEQIGCWFTSDRTRLLVNFLPRWIIIAVMLCLYARLYHIIHRAHDNFVSIDEEYGSNSRSLRSTSRHQSITLNKMSDGSDLERIVPDSPPPVPRPRHRKRSGGATDLKRVRTSNPEVIGSVTDIHEAFISNDVVSSGIHAYLGSAYQYPNLPSGQRQASSIPSCHGRQGMHCRPRSPGRHCIW